MRLIDGLQAETAAGVCRARISVGLARAIDAALAASREVAPVLVISGFWRSGTTWLQESLATSLGAKTVFEPLSPMHPRRRAQIATLFDNDEDRLQAFIPPAGLDPAVWTLLDDACSGRYGDPFLMSCRETVRESWRRAVVIKDVRIQNNLPDIHRRYGSPIVHIRRHPCAVAASLLAARWHWSFARVPLRRLNLQSFGLSPGDEQRLAGWDTDEVSRIAVIWALSERRAAKSIEDQPWSRMIAYEAFCANPCATIASLCGWLGRPQVAVPSAAKPSASIHPDRFVADREDERWRTQLSSSTIARIERIATDLYSTWRAPWLPN